MNEIQPLEDNIRLKMELAKVKEYLDILDVQMLTGFSASTIRLRVSEGKLKALQNVPNGRILFTRKQIQTWLEGGAR
jgi:hypothetical protein